MKRPKRVKAFGESYEKCRVPFCRRIARNENGLCDHHAMARKREEKRED